MATDTPLKTANFAHPKRNVGALGVEPGMQVADFGSGSGIYILHIAEALENTGRVYAIDVQRDLLRRVKNEANRRGFKNVDIIWTDLEHPGSSKLADKRSTSCSSRIFCSKSKTKPLSSPRQGGYSNPPEDLLSLIGRSHSGD